MSEEMIDKVADKYLSDRWKELAPHAAHFYAGLRDMHDNPLRHYHTMQRPGSSQHIYRTQLMLDDVIKVLPAEFLEKEQRTRNATSHPRLKDPWAAVALFCFLYDAVYHAISKRNEQDSAIFAHALFWGVDQQLTMWLGDTIQLSKHRDVDQPKDNAQALSLDLDLASLGSPEEEFYENSKMIWFEYRNHGVSWTAFRDGRIKIMGVFRARAQESCLYNTKFMNDKLNGQAEANLEAHLEELERCQFDPPKDWR